MNPVDWMSLTMKTENILAKAFRVILIERRLPYGLTRWLQEILYKGPLDSTLQAIVNTPPLACSPSAQTELHMVTCTRDLNMAVSSCRSLLRFAPDLAVVFHGDQSLNDNHARFLKAAVPGARVHLYGEAGEIASQSPRVSRLRGEMPARFNLGKGYERHRKAWALKVFDFHLLANAKKVIVLDSDTLFLKKPDELINWINSQGNPGFYSVPLLPNLRVDESKSRRTFPNARIIERFNGGFFGFSTDSLTLDLMVDIAEKLISDKSMPILGDECIWRFAFAHVPSEEIPYESYPLTTHIKRSRKIVKDLSNVKYVHFILKHKGGHYRKLAKQVESDLKRLERN